MYTIDASVHLSALNPAEPDSSASQALFVLIQRHEIALFSPTLLLVEVAAAVAASLGDPRLALALVGALRALPHQTLVPLDEELAEGAAQLAALARLRGSDAVYGAVAERYGATLVTLDGRQLDRLPPTVRVARPAEVVEAWG